MSNNTYPTMKPCYDCTVRGYAEKEEVECQFLEKGQPEICIFHSSPTINDEGVRILGNKTEATE